MTEAAFVALVRASAVYRAADGLLRGVQRAWPTSWLHRNAIDGATDRIRFWSLTAVVASATALLTAPLGTTPAPLAWIVPALGGLIAVAIVALTPTR